ncbi:SipW-dependent-type signal peptide-containing protein [Ruminococcus sp. OA3]|uniref:SipW-dependent-type signal peptide-containing protein n=1 Tax=Ruminococcus sp. OA3 TaxID=2914164 RepID=UPI001F05A5C7|nr:SipW-dependent-type signal peptide-containing protein [Ruminococcus sp. OA3]MCH1981315.1 SipW-dependent-type signal peptide-containing protein [Ruminococcus sp. OA3]
MANKKRIATTIGAMALTAVLAVGGTLAYLSSVTETEKNVFTSSKSITTELTEEFDPEVAGSYTPGQVITKAPTMSNTSDSNESIWVAVSLDYTNGADSITYEEFKQYAEVQGLDTTGWEKIGTAADGQELYAFKTVLAPGADTSAIFSSVKVNAGIQKVWKYGTEGEIVYTMDEDGNLIDVKDNTELVDEVTYYNAKGEEINPEEAEAGLPTYTIEVKGYAVQASDVNYDLAKTELTKLANSALGVVFQ